MLLLLLSLLLFGAITGSRRRNVKLKKLNHRPIIAVLAQKYKSTSTQSYIAASYVKYLESAGARVVPIPHNFTESKIKEIFQYVNGVLLPGGAAEPLTSHYYHHAKQFWDMALEANNGGNYFPVWGTCLGIQTLYIIRMNLNMLSRRVASDLAMPLNFTANAKASKLFRGIDKDLYAALGSENITYNHHHYGIEPATHEAHLELKNFFNVLSLNKDVNGNEFISTVEAYKYPIYGVQWHPEKSNFEFTTKYNNIPHSVNAVRITQYMANFFVNEARKNYQKFPTKEMEDEYLIYKYTPVHSAKKYKTGTLSKFEQIYLF